MPEPTSYELAIETCSVSLLPVDHPERRHYSLVLERRPGERWVVTRDRWYCDAAGEWSYGGSNSDEWRAAHWHTWEDAVRLASAACAEIVVNGRSARDAAGQEARDA